MLRFIGKKCRYKINQGFLRRFRDPIRVPRIENRVPRISENCHRVPRIRENRFPRIGEIGSLQVHNGYLTFSLKKNWINHNYFLKCFIPDVTNGIKEQWRNKRVVNHFACRAVSCMCEFVEGQRFT